MPAIPSIRPLSQKQVDVLCAFKGFGRVDAPVWFLGMEEGGSDPALLHARTLWDPIMDLREAHVDSLGIKKHHERSRALQSTWRPMCMLMLLIEQPEISLWPQDRGAFATNNELIAYRRGSRDFVMRLKAYQAERLGRVSPEGQTFLCELLPIPKPAENQYPFPELFPMWAGHEHYKTDVLANRKDLLRDLILQSRPKVVVCYGKKFWASYEALFDVDFFPPDIQQPELLPSWEKDEHSAHYTKLKIGRTPNNTLVLLTDHLTRLGSNRMISELAGFLRANR